MGRSRMGPVPAEMLEAIEGIERHTVRKSLIEFERDWLLRLGVQRALEIISEASRHIPDDVLTAEPEVPWKNIRGIGNILRHEYHKIADDVIWVVVTENILPLKAAVKAIQQRIGEEG
ncbi:uncharacterized protein with HEPN domain [Rhizobium sp. PP-F2F-G38]|nr:uncharacterized protein with HEPN domain [Rhizobium sp. PP-WC-1G-195]PYE94388.1 uncharacterized protein with HEPN domain [Rhizobium sp. PP-F2F-G38]